MRTIVSEDKQKENSTGQDKNRGYDVPKWSVCLYDRGHAAHPCKAVKEVRLKRIYDKSYQYCIF